MRRPSPAFTFPVLLLLVFGVLLLLEGCASTARYRIRRIAPRNAPPEFRKEIREEAVEDDKVVDPDTVLPEIASSSTVASDEDRSTVTRQIAGMIGTPYSYSGVDKEGIDCSGFTMKIFSALGKILPHSAREQFRDSKPVPEGKAQFGDLVFFNTTGESPSHVGIYLGGGYFAHASVSSGVTISSMESMYYKKRYIATRRMGK